MSKKPIPLSRAKAQMRALYAAERQQKEGKGKASPLHQAMIHARVIPGLYKEQKAKADKMPNYHADKLAEQGKVADLIPKHAKAMEHLDKAERDAMVEDKRLPVQKDYPTSPLKKEQKRLPPAKPIKTIYKERSPTAPRGRGMCGGVLTKAERKEYGEIQQAMSSLRELKKSLQPAGTKVRDLPPEARQQLKEVDTMYKKLSARFQELLQQEMKPADETDDLPPLPRSTEETAEAPRDLGAPHMKLSFKGKGRGGARGREAPEPADARAAYDRFTARIAERQRQIAENNEGAERVRGQIANLQGRIAETQAKMADPRVPRLQKASLQPMLQDDAELVQRLQQTLQRTQDANWALQQNIQLLEGQLQQLDAQLRTTTEHDDEIDEEGREVPAEQEVSVHEYSSDEEVKGKGKGRKLKGGTRAQDRQRIQFLQTRLEGLQRQYDRAQGERKAEIGSQITNIQHNIAEIHARLQTPETGTTTPAAPASRTRAPSEADDPKAQGKGIRRGGRRVDAPGAMIPSYSLEENVQHHLNVFEAEAATMTALQDEYDTGIDDLNLIRQQLFQTTNEIQRLRQELAAMPSPPADVYEDYRTKITDEIQGREYLAGQAQEQNAKLDHLLAQVNAQQTRLNQAHAAYQAALAAFNESPTTGAGKCGGAVPIPPEVQAEAEKLNRFKKPKFLYDWRMANDPEFADAQRARISADKAKADAYLASDEYKQKTASEKAQKEAGIAEIRQKGVRSFFRFNDRGNLVQFHPNLPTGLLQSDLPDDIRAEIEKIQSGWKSYGEQQNEKAKEWNDEMRRRRDSPLGKFMEGLVKIGDIAVSALPFLAPGIGTAASELYKLAAPPGSEHYDERAFGEKLKDRVIDVAKNPIKEVVSQKLEGVAPGALKQFVRPGVGALVDTGAEALKGSGEDDILVSHARFSNSRFFGE